MKLTVQEVAKAVGAKNTLADLDDVPLRSVEFDSRKIQAGDLFVPLKGARDGHEFIATAFENGAILTLSEKELEDYPYLLVDDCLTALQLLAQYYLTKTGVDVIAVTGSNGKTTTKDMIAAVLSTTFATYKTQGNYNNEIGLPYTALHMPDDTEKIVLEMGQDHLGDIHLLSQIAKPRISVVTMIGEAHLEFFGSREKIAEGKMQITDGMDAEGILLAPTDPIVEDYLPDNMMVIRFGDGEEVSVKDLQEEKDSLSFQTDILSKRVHLPVPGKYNAMNAVLAACVGKVLAVEDEDILEALATIELTRNRTEWKKAANGADILSDVYNANPTAMKLILETFSAIPANQGGKKIAVLADMKELGETSVSLHNSVLESLQPETIDTLFFYGQDIESLSQLASQQFPPNQVYFYQKNETEDQFEEMLKKIKDLLAPEDQILLKGSNSMNLSKIVEALETSDK
ncbi:UDP-N-acetylmuramoyl-tripeptide--D-alanyl-D-alanine ligase [Streptococcus cameli]